MKHNTKITVILILMFIVTQLIGMFVVQAYTNGLELPYIFQPPEEVKQNPAGFFYQLIIAFVLAIFLFFILTKINAEKFIRIWFFSVVIISLALTLNVIIAKASILNSFMIALIFAVPLAYFKVFKRNVIVHNITELLIYPGIAAVFVPVLNVLGIILLLLIISLYDIWAVWHSEFMQKMARYQIDNLKFFTGFFIPYLSKKQKQKVKKIKQKYSKKELENQFKKAKIKVNLAILGGGDIIFPIITAGVFYKSFGSLAYAFTISLSATIALLFLFILARKGKFYPAMPFLTIGMYTGMILNWVLF